MNSASDRAREASSACEIILASDPDIALSVCCFQILLPPESILFIKTRLIIDQFKRPSISRRQNVVELPGLCQHYAAGNACANRPCSPCKTDSQLRTVGRKRNSFYFTGQGHVPPPRCLSVEVAFPKYAVLRGACPNLCRTVPRCWQIPLFCASMFSSAHP